MLNSYFNNITSTVEQDLVENYIIEAIQVRGMDIVYCPKTLVDFNKLLGEDAQRAFNANYVVEAYFENVDGFMGDKNFLNKFGLNIDKQAVFNVAKKRFDQVLYPTITWTGLWDSTITYGINAGVEYLGILYKSLVTNNINFSPDTSTSQWVVVEQIRPYEGDLIYLPITHDLFEISFVDHEEVFYQLGKIYVWKITCEKFRYSHEDIATGNTDIDDIASEIESNTDPLADNNEILTRIEASLIDVPNNPFTQ